MGKGHRRSNFLREECNFKTKLINSLLENLLNHENHEIKLHNGNTILTPNKIDDYQVPKRQACKRKFQSQSNPQLTLLNRYQSLRDYISERNDDVIATTVNHFPPEEHASEKNVKTSDSRKHMRSYLLPTKSRNPENIVLH